MTMLKSKLMCLRNLGLLTLCSILLGISNMGVAATSSAAPIVPLDSVIAVVNNEVITQSDLDSQVRIVQNQLERSHTQVPNKKDLQRQVLNHMIDQSLELQQAKQMGIDVDTASVNASVAQIAQQNGMTLDQFQKVIQQQGMSYNAFRNDVRNQMIVNKLQQQEVAPNVTISQQEVDNYIKAMGTQKQQEYHLASIFIALPQVPSPDQLESVDQRVGSIMTQLKSGVDFSQLAIAESNGPNALKGGDMGWMQLAQIPPQIAQKITAMKVGGLLDPLRTPNGYVIIKLLGTREADNRKVITQTEARHILLKTNALFTDADAKAELLKIRQQVVSGASFADLAKKYSQDPGSAAKGGALGWVSPGELVPPFEKAMDGLQPGQMSQPVQTQFGWHLIQVLARRQQDVTQQVQENQVRNYIFQRKFQEALQNWLSQMHDIAYIKIMLDGPGKATEKLAKPAALKNNITEGTLPTPAFNADGTPDNSQQNTPPKNLLPRPGQNPAKNAQNNGNI